MAICPEGHDSEATDYCDICGTPIEASPLQADAPASPTPGPGMPDADAGDSVLDLGAPAAAPTQTCPHCGALNVADALFCEDCGYDFTTGALPLGAEPETEPAPEATEPEPAEPEAAEPKQEAAESEAAGPEVTELRQAEPDTEVPPAPRAEPAAGPAPEQEPEEEPEAVSAPVAEPPAATAGPPEPAAADPAPTTSHARPRHTPPSRDLADTWVVEVWIDPDWYAVQQTEEACPSAGVPDVVVVRRSVALIGRPSSSLGARPDVDAGADSAVSRRHAQLTSDGRRWWIEDLGSSNGTFVGSVGEPVPTQPLTPGQRVEIDRDDRIYVGAWTRLVLRQATDSEREGQG